MEGRVIRLIVPEISYDTILAGIGMPQESKSLNPVIQQLLEETVIEATTELIKPQALLVKLPLTSFDEQTSMAQVENGPMSGSLPIPTSAMSGVEGFVALLTTIGPELEDVMERKAVEGDHLGAMMLDTIGSTAVMEAASSAKLIAESELMESGYAIGRTLEPGVGEISLELQRALFKVMDVDSVGLSLNDSILMIPKKSVSALIPYGHQVECESGCGSCMKEEHGGCPCQCPHKRS